MSTYENHKSGYVAIIGKPNIGKSTLLNQILGTKLSIVTHKAQTTRHQVIGIHSEENAQVIFLDTPGIINPKYELQKAMMRFVEKAEKDADLILYIVDATDTELPEYAFDSLKILNKPTLLVLNKIDLCQQEDLAGVSEEINAKYPFKDTLFVSALNGFGINKLIETIIEHLPFGPPYYDKDDLSEHPVRFFVSELIREQVFLLYHEELPYSTTVDVILYEERPDLDYINAEIIVNRESQKGMIIGKGGKAIKRLGKAARATIEEFVGKRIYLDLHVKVRENWREKEKTVRNMGY